MWSHGTGAEVMERIAVPMIGGKSNVAETANSLGLVAETIP